MRQLNRTDTLSNIDVANAQRATTDLQLTDSATPNLAAGWDTLSSIPTATFNAKSDYAYPCNLAKATH